MAGAVFDVGVRFTQTGNLDAPATRLKELAGHAEKAEDHTKKIADMAGKLSGGFNGVSAAANGFNSVLDSIGSSLLHIGATAATAITGGIVVGLEEGIKQGFKFNAMIEDLRISLAGMFAQTKGVGDMEGFDESQMFGAGLNQADAIISKMRRDAAELPGEFKDLGEIMQTVSSPMLQMGMSMEATENLSANLMATAYMKGKVPYRVAAREMTAMLEGNTRSQMPLYHRLGLKGEDGHLLTPDELNRMKTYDRYKLLAKAVDNKEVRAAYGNTWTGASSTAIDKVRGAVGMVSHPLFESVKDKLIEFNKWATDNKGGLRGLGERLGDDLKRAFEKTYHYLESAYHHWKPVVEKFSDSLFTELESVWHRIAKVMEPIMGKVEKMMSDPRIFQKLEHVAALGLGLRVGGAAVSAGASLAGAGFGMLSRNPGMLAGAAELGPAAIVAAAAVAALGVAVFGVVDALSDPTNSWYGKMHEATSQISNNLDSTGHYFKELGELLHPVANALGYGLLQVVNNVITLFREVGWVVEHVIDGMRVFADQFSWIIDLLNEKLDLMERHGVVPVRPDSDQHEAIDHPIDLENLVDLSHKVLDWHAIEQNVQNAVPKTHVTVHKVEIKVNSNQDPQRIAKSTAQVFADWTRHPKTFSQGGSGIPTLTRPSF